MSNMHFATDVDLVDLPGEPYVDHAAKEWSIACHSHVRHLFAGQLRNPVKDGRGEVSESRLTDTIANGERS